MPTPRARNTTITTGAVCARAKPIAVPRKGAEQGVAIRVANRPEKKWPAIPSRAAVPSSRASARGSGISNSPHRLRQKSTTTTARKATKPGCWNCTPQPTAAPAARKETAASPSARKEARMPAEVARAPRTTSARPWPALRTRPKSLSESTGSTQGMALRMSPPSTASSSVRARLPAGFGTGAAVGAAAGAGAAAAGPLPSPAAGGVKRSACRGLPPGSTLSWISACEVTGGRHCESLQAW